MSSRDGKPQGETSNLYSGKEGRHVLRVTRRNAAPTLEIQKSVFNQMAMFVQCFVIESLLFAVLAWRNDRVHALRLGLLNNGIAIVALVGQQILGCHAINQWQSLCAICTGTLCNNDSERHTKRIHGQMYLGVKPPFETLMA